MNEPATAESAVNEPAAEVAFDTLAAADDLQQADFNPKQATGIVRAITDSQRNLATKSDIRELKGDIRGLENRMDGLEAQLKATNDRVDTLRMILLGVVVPLLLANLGFTAMLFFQMHDFMELLNSTPTVTQ